MLPRFLGSESQKEMVKWIDAQGNHWNNELARRTQHFGFKYDYSRHVTALSPAAPVPHYLKQQGEAILETLQHLVIILREEDESELADKISTFVPEQYIINEYKPGQGIAPHVDHTKVFGEVICSISLGSSAVMNFEKVKSRGKKRARQSEKMSSPVEGGQVEEDDVECVRHLLQPGTLCVMSDQSRWNYKHSINKRKKDDLSKVDLLALLSEDEDDEGSNEPLLPAGQFLARDRRLSVTMRMRQ